MGLYGGCKHLPGWQFFTHLSDVIKITITKQSFLTHLPHVIIKELNKKINFAQICALSLLLNLPKLFFCPDLRVVIIVKLTQTTIFDTFP